MIDAATLALLPDAAVAVGADGRVVAANGLAARLTGRGTLVGAAASDVLPLTEESGEDWWACRRPLGGNARLVARLPEQALTLRTGDGRERPVTLTAARAAAADGTVALLVLLVRRAERRARLDAARSELVSTVSHELRSPLTSVKGFTQTLLARWERFSDAQRQAMLRVIQEDADRVTRLLSELLDVSRIDAHVLRLRLAPVEPGALVERVVSRFAVPDGDRTIVAALTPTAPVLADADKLQQVLANLIENAMRHGDGMVTVALHETPDGIEITVTDEGPGVPEAALRDIFGKYARHGRDVHTAGTGLGLYIAKGIVDAHGGRLWATSPSGQGATFHCTLPREGPVASAGEEART